MPTFYHYTSTEYNGGDLLSLSARAETMGQCWAKRRALRWTMPEVLGYVAQALRDARLARSIERGVDAYLAGDGSLVSLHPSIEAAEEWMDAYGRNMTSRPTLLVINVPADADITADINGCPAIPERIPAAWITTGGE